MSITQFTEFPVTAVGLYPWSPLIGMWSTLKTQAEAVASHQTLNQIQFKEKGLDMLPVSKLVGIPFAWFTQDCPRERLNAGDASLKDSKHFIVLPWTHATFSGKTAECCGQGAEWHSSRKARREVCPSCIGGRRHCSSVPLKQLSSMSWLDSSWTRSRR